MLGEHKKKLEKLESNCGMQFPKLLLWLTSQNHVCVLIYKMFFLANQNAHSIIVIL